jgi:hypothetical protein
MGRGTDGWSEERIEERVSSWGLWTPVRFAADVFVLPRLSFGTALRLDYQNYSRTEHRYVSGSHLPPQSYTSQESRHHALITVSPRLGYGTWFGSGFGSWVRAGLDLSHQAGGALSTSSPQSQQVWGPIAGISVEALAVVTPFPHTFMAIGPTYRFTSSDGGSTHLLAVAANLGVEL